MSIISFQDRRQRIETEREKIKVSTILKVTAQHLSDLIYELIFLAFIRKKRAMALTELEEPSIAPKCNDTIHHYMEKLH